jgi:hypothetical protein
LCQFYIFTSLKSSYQLKLKSMFLQSILNLVRLLFSHVKKIWSFNQWNLLQSAFTPTTGLFVFDVLNINCLELKSSLKLRCSQYSMGIWFLNVLFRASTSLCVHIFSEVHLFDSLCRYCVLVNWMSFLAWFLKGTLELI